MSIATIRAAARDMLATVPGLNEVLPYPPESVGPLPVAYFGDATAEITMGSSEVFTWIVPLTVLASGRKAVFAQEVAASEALFDGLMAAIRSHYTLGGLSFGMALYRLTEGAVTIGGSQYVGFTMQFRIKEKTAVSLTG